MRFWLCSLTLLTLAACEQPPSEGRTDANWSDSIGRMVVDRAALTTAELTPGAGASEADGQILVATPEDSSYDQVLRITTLRQPPRLDSLEVTIPTTDAVGNGDSCWLHLNARAQQPQVETGMARLGLAFRASGQRRRPAFQHSVYVEPDWTSIDLPFKANGKFAAGESDLVIAAGTQLQVLELADLAVRCFDRDTALERLPRSSFTYAGREPEALWRETAAGRIERYRKADILVQVVDVDGNSVPDAEVHVQMQRHAFAFGTAIDAELLAAASPGGGPSPYSDQDTATYRRLLADLFNAVAFENGMDWIPWTDPAQRRVTEDALAWINSIGLDLRGGPLITAGWSQLPRALEDDRDNPAAVETAIEQRIANTVGALNGAVAEWDVLEEPREQNDLMALLGWEAVGDWFKEVRAAAPAPRLLVNESDVLGGDGLPGLMSLVDRLLTGGAPLGAIGVKGQFGLQPPSIQVLSDRLDQLASFDLPLVITAYTIDSVDEQLQADFTRDLMTLAFSKPGVDGFVQGGFWAGRQDVVDGAMYNQDFTLKANGQAYRDLVLGRWWTNEVDTTNEDGSIVTRGFLGDYTVSARLGDRSATAGAKLGLDGTNVTLRLPN
jgi:GH35 family endo-1,4-beta-xylanase